MCHESLKGPLVVVRCFDNSYYTYCEHGSNIIATFWWAWNFDSFESEIFVLHRNMQLKVIKVIKSFLQFVKFFDGM
jgi:hypothetical protein